MAHEHQGPNFTTEAVIRARAKAGSAPPGWADKQIGLAREAGLLLTPQQLVDLTESRDLQVGDKARYVGPDREEPLDEGDGTTSRPFGQEGHIAQAAGGVVTFMPRDGTRGLEVRLGTRCGFLLERVP